MYLLADPTVLIAEIACGVTEAQLAAARKNDARVCGIPSSLKRQSACRKQSNWRKQSCYKAQRIMSVVRIRHGVADGYAPTPPCVQGVETDIGVGNRMPCALGEGSKRFSFRGADDASSQSHSAEAVQGTSATLNAAAESVEGPSDGCSIVPYCLPAFHSGGMPSSAFSIPADGQGGAGNAARAPTGTGTAQHNVRPPEALLQLSYCAPTALLLLSYRSHTALLLLSYCVPRRA